MGGGPHNIFSDVRGKITSLVLLPKIAAAARVPVLGSGGFGSGASLVAALALGAEGIHCGTAFLATEESFAHEYHKQRVVEASSEDTVYSDVFAIGWPPQSPVRTIENSVTKQHGQELSTIPAFSRGCRSVWEGLADVARVNNLRHSASFSARWPLARKP